MSKTVLVLMAGPLGVHPLEQQMGHVLRAAARETLRRITATGWIDRAIVAAPDPAGLEPLEGEGPDVRLDVDPDPRGFGFGARLAGLIDRYRIPRLLYIGAGASPLMSTTDWAEVLAAFAEMGEGVLTNNLHSSDWIAVAPAAAVLRHVHRLPTDNAMAWVLHREGGLPARVWPRSTASLLDLDTPVDALIAAQHPLAPQALREAVAEAGWDASPVRRLQELLRTPGSRLVIAGRVPSWAWAVLERHAQVWTRVFSEERGMQASTRMLSGEVRSLVYAYLQAVGPERFFQTLAELADGALLDIRVWMAAAGRWPDPVDRYAADLRMPGAIRDPVLRAWVEAAVRAPLALLLGGHTLVSAGLVAMLEAALGIPRLSLP